MCMCVRTSLHYVYKLCIHVYIYICIHIHAYACCLWYGEQIHVPQNLDMLPVYPISPVYSYHWDGERANTYTLGDGMFGNYCRA